MRYIILIAICVTSCSAHKPTKVDTETFEPMYVNCQPAPPAVPLPRQPRTFESVAEWAKLTEIQRMKTVTALNECRKLLEYSQQGKR